MKSVATPWLVPKRLLKNGKGGHDKDIYQLPLVSTALLHIAW